MKQKKSKCVSYDAKSDCYVIDLRNNKDFREGASYYKSVLFITII